MSLQPCDSRGDCIAMPHGVCITHSASHRPWGDSSRAAWQFPRVTNQTDTENWMDWSPLCVVIGPPSSPPASISAYWFPKPQTIPDKATPQTRQFCKGRFHKGRAEAASRYTRSLESMVAGKSAVPRSIALCSVLAIVSALLLLGARAENFIRVVNGEFVDGCDKFLIAGWNQWEVRNPQ